MRVGRVRDLVQTRAAPTLLGIWVNASPPFPRYYVASVYGFWIYPWGFYSIFYYHVAGSVATTSRLLAEPT